MTEVEKFSEMLAKLEATDVPTVDGPGAARRGKARQGSGRPTGRPIHFNRARGVCARAHAHRNSMHVGRPNRTFAAILARSVMALRRWLTAGTVAARRSILIRAACTRR